MDTVYAKAALYMYPRMIDYARQIDDHVHRKTMSSHLDHRPALKIIYEIISLKTLKEQILELYSLITAYLLHLNNKYLDCVYYKYFRKLSHEYNKDFDPKSRRYFRQQNRLIDKFACALEASAFNDEWFEDHLDEWFIANAVTRAVQNDEYQKKKEIDRWRKTINRLGRFITKNLIQIPISA